MVVNLNVYGKSRRFILFIVHSRIEKKYISNNTKIALSITIIMTNKCQEPETIKRRPIHVITSISKATYSNT